VDINYQRLLKRIGHPFANSALFEQALTHRSYSAQNNERLEFLGDAVLGLLISHILYERFEDANEGELSQLRASLVKGEALAEVARELGIGEHLRLGGGEMKSGGARRDTILADALEAIIGAIFLDAGIPACRDRIAQWFSSRLDNLSLGTFNKDAKTLLQEYLQAHGRELPLYEVIATNGEAHACTFTVRCGLRDVEQSTVGEGIGARIVEGIGEGSSRKKAEQAAAKVVLEQFRASEHAHKV